MLNVIPEVAGGVLSGVVNAGSTLFSQQVNNNILGDVIAHISYGLPRFARPPVISAYALYDHACDGLDRNKYWLAKAIIYFLGVEGA